MSAIWPVGLNSGVGRVAGGVAWAAVYNALWGLAWLGFMRREWSVSASASGHLVPWRGEFWALWLPITLLFGIAITGYLAGRSRPRKSLHAAGAATLAVWIPGTVGMAVGAGFSVRIAILDAAVNLVALLVASAAVARVADGWQGAGGGSGT